MVTDTILTTKNNYFIKSVFENGDHPIELITSFTDNKFGANGFYASPSATEQYEETQSSFVGLSMSIFSEKLVLKPKFIGEEVRTNTYIRDNHWSQKSSYYKQDFS